MDKQTLPEAARVIGDYLAQDDDLHLVAAWVDIPEPMTISAAIVRHSDGVVIAGRVYGSNLKEALVGLAAVLNKQQRGKP